MGMNPFSEDFERLAVRWATSAQLKGDYPNVVAAITAFPELYAKNREALPQNDSDRAFGLVARAVKLLDVDSAFAQSDDAAARCIEEAAGLVHEALKLDPLCHDARRIMKYMEHPSRDEMVEYLSSTVDTVRAECLEVARKNGLVPPEGQLSYAVYMRPYLRWLFDLANEQLGCGRYRRSLDVCMRAMEEDASDAACLRHIAVLDYVKLEDEEGLNALAERYPDSADDAWFRLSRCIMAYKLRRLDEATRILHELVAEYDRAGCTLSYQDEVHPGMFTHLDFAEGSADELFIAVSEAAVVLDENCGDFLSPLSDWIARDPVVEQACAEVEARDGVRRPSPAEASGTTAPGAPAGGPAAPAAPRKRSHAAGAAPVADAPAEDPAAPGVSDGPDVLSGFDDVETVEDLLAALSKGGSAGDPSASADPAAPDAPGDPSGSDDPSHPDIQGR